ncbi:MAG: NUDIX hydrolase [Actinomycetota bacterium]|nr:NUDIX hydrolase [Actinomycetota bacterium]
MGGPEVCVGAVVVDGDRLLLVRRGRAPAAGEWSIPGGRVEAGELLAEAVVRELKEETGIDGVCGPLLAWVELVGEDHHFVVLDFTVRPLPGQDPVAGDDAAEAAWVRLDEVAELGLVAGLAEVLVDHGVLPPSPSTGCSPSPGERCA